MTAGVTCGSCGTGLRATAKFCDNCGTATANSAHAAKYKQVTVLFADVVQSMDMAARIDIERLREIMIDLVTRLAAVIRRYGGTVEYNGDGVMALFGAPAALEDHASRACLAGLAVQQEAGRLAAEVQRRDGVALQLRVGLNSGRVIAGNLGSGSLGYAATGETVGFAQRMEAAAPPGGVMLSESTALLVEHTARLAEPEFVHIKGVDEPASSRRLLAIASPDGVVGRAEAGLVGRRWEMAALDAIVDRAIGGRGAIVNVVGPPGIGKSRVAREAAAVAAERGFEVLWTFCESHARDVPFSAVTRLLRAGSGITDLDDADARVRLRGSVPPDADPQDLCLLDDLLGIADPELPLPQVDPDARRRRLTALINSVTMARTQPALFIIEDAHWIDAVSESLLAEFLTVVVRTPTVVLITARPDYEGTLSRVRGGQAIALAPLSDADIASLIDELLGSHSSVGQLASLIVERADGNPFFAEEMVRELVQRGVLTGNHGAYLCSADVAELSVPATVQAAIEARIDRLSAPARRTVDAASLIGARFGAELITALGVEPMIDDLLSAELIDQVRFTPRAEYAFRHPLIRAVAYESQLKSDRADWHRRLAAVIQEREPDSVDENSALIAEHLRAAGDLAGSYAWHMRAGGWAMNRDLDSARLSYEQARQIADDLPEDDPNRLPMRIAPRTMLCATSWREVESSRDQFEDLKELSAAAGDKLSVAIGMTALASELLYAGRSAEGIGLVREQLALLDSIGDPAPTMGLAYVLFCICFDSGEFAEILDRSQIIIDAAAGDPVMGASFGVGSPLAVALAWRSTARLALGIAGWRADLDDAVAMARDVDPTTYAAVLTWSNSAVHYGMVSVDDFALDAMEDALESARAHSNDTIVAIAMYSLAGALLRCDDESERQRGVELMKKTRDSCDRERALFLVSVADAWIARENARRGDRDAAISVLRASSDELYLAARPAYGVMCTEFLVETLLERGTADDLAEAQSLIDRIQTLRPERDWVIRDAIALRLRALLADARGDQVAFRDSVSRYRTVARSLGCDEGHTDSAQPIVAGGT